MSGWIKLHRQIIESDVFVVPELLQLFIWLLCSASHSNQSYPMKCGHGTRLVKLQPGQVVIGRFTAATKLGWKPSTFRDRLERLKSMELISIKPDRQWSIVSVTKWKEFQSLISDRTTAKPKALDDNQEKRVIAEKTKGKSSSKKDAPTGGRQADDNRPTGERQPPDTYKNEENEENEENVQNEQKLKTTTTTRDLSESSFGQIATLTGQAVEVVRNAGENVSEDGWSRTCEAIATGLKHGANVKAWIDSARKKRNLSVGYFAACAQRHCKAKGIEFDAAKITVEVPFEATVKEAAETLEAKKDSSEKPVTAFEWETAGRPGLSLCETIFSGRKLSPSVAANAFEEEGGNSGKARFSKQQGPGVNHDPNAAASDSSIGVM